MDHSDRFPAFRIRRIVYQRHLLHSFARCRPWHHRRRRPSYRESVLERNVEPSAWLAHTPWCCRRGHQLSGSDLFAHGQKELLAPDLGHGARSFCLRFSWRLFAPHLRFLLFPDQNLKASDRFSGKRVRRLACPDWIYPFDGALLQIARRQAVPYRRFL